MKPRTRNALPGLALAAGLALFALGSDADAQVFKWVGADGKVNYSDVPPPPSARPAQKKSFTGNVVDSGDLPFSVAEVAKSSPVTIYTAPKCQPCDEGRQLLTGRGIPFAEKTVTSNADIASLGSGGVDLPQLSVGASKLKGFESGAWNSSLTAAGYPETSRLPKTYRNPPPQAAVPGGSSATTASGGELAAGGNGAAPAARRKPAPRATPATPAANPENNPAGIRF